MKNLFVWSKLSTMRLKPLTPWVGGVIGGFVFVILIWFLLAKLPQQNIPPVVSEEAKRRADLVNSNRENVLKVIQTLAGLGFIATAYLAWKNSQLTEDKNVTDRFSKAVEMLADERLEMRLGGIFALERIAKDSQGDYPIVMEVLTAFIREQTASEEYQQLSKPTTDIQSALTVIGRRDTNNDLQTIDLSYCHLAGVTLREANFQGVMLWGANLQNAKLSQTNFQNACLSEVNLQNAHLRKAILQGADLCEANLERAFLMTANLKNACLHKANLEKANLEATDLQLAELWDANLQGTGMFGANLQGADLAGANLQGANLWNANLQYADLLDASFKGANLSNANFQDTNITEEQRASARIDETA